MVTDWTLVIDGSRLDTGQRWYGWTLVSSGHRLDTFQLWSPTGHWSVVVTDWTLVSSGHRLDTGQ